MSFTAASVILEARDAWAESAEGDILTDAQCWRVISDGIGRLRALRTDLLLDENQAETVYADITASADVIPMNVRFRAVLAQYLIARGFQAKANLQNNKERVRDHMAAFEQQARTA